MGGAVPAARAFKAEPAARAILPSPDDNWGSAGDRRAVLRKKCCPHKCMIQEDILMLVALFTPGLTVNFFPQQQILAKPAFGRHAVI